MSSTRTLGFALARMALRRPAAWSLPSSSDPNRSASSGKTRVPLPIIWAYSARLLVGRAWTMTLVAGASNPSVAIMQLQRYWIRPALTSATICRRSSFGVAWSMLRALIGSSSLNFIAAYCALLTPGRNTIPWRSGTMARVRRTMASQPLSIAVSSWLATKSPALTPTTSRSTCSMISSWPWTGTSHPWSMPSAMSIT